MIGSRSSTTTTKMTSLLWALLVSLIFGLPHRALSIHFVKRPVSMDVIEGQTAVLECEVDRKKPCETVYWAFRWDNDDGLWRYIKVSDGPGIGQEDISDEIGRSHFTDRGSYSTSVDAGSGRSGMGNVETYALRISNATHLDSGLYMCISKPGYLGDEETGLDTSSIARLNVIIPNGQGIISCQLSVSNPQVGGLAYLDCNVVNETDIKENYKLTWMRNREELESVRKGYNTFSYRIQKYDNGQTFHCALQEPGNEGSTATCSVQPFFQRPTVSLKPSSLIVYEGTDAIFTCVASGIPSIKTFVWYVNGLRIFIRGTETNITMENQSYTSTLRVRGVRASDDNTRVVCVAAVALGVSSNQSSRLTVRSVVDFETVLVPDGKLTVVQQMSVFFRCSIKPFELIDIVSYTWLVDGIKVYQDTNEAGNNSSTRPVLSGPQVDIVTDRSAESILHIRNPGSSLSPVNITCKLAIPNLEPRQKSCLLSLTSSGDESMVKYVVITVGTGGACFVLGMLAAFILFYFYPMKLFKRRRDDLQNGTDVTADGREGSSKEQQKECQSIKTVAEKSKYSVGQGCQHTYADINKVDGEKSELGMHENRLMVAYEQIPADVVEPIRNATLPSVKAKQHRTQTTSGTFKEGTKAGSVKGEQSFSKLVKKWSPTTGESGYEIPTALTAGDYCEKIN